MATNLIPSDVASAVSGLTSLISVLDGANRVNAFPTPTAFSTVSGLDRAGEMHSGYLASESAAAMRAYADRFNNAASVLRANLTSFVSGDVKIAELMGAVGLASQVKEYNEIINPETLNTETEHFTAALPAAGRPISLEALSSQMHATNFGMPSTMTSEWTALSSKAVDAANELTEVLANLQSSAETEAIANAIDYVTRLQNTGLAFGVNTGVMGGHTANLGTGALAMGQTVVSAALTKAMLPGASGLAFEQTFLNAFPAMLTTALTPSVPVITQLLPPMEQPGGAINVSAPSVPETPTFEQIVLPEVVQQAMEAVGFGEAARITNPQDLASEFQRQGMDHLQSIAAGNTPTVTASAPAVSMPPSLNPGVTNTALPTGTLSPHGAVSTAPAQLGLGGVPLGAGASPRGASAMTGPNARSPLESNTTRGLPVGGFAPGTSTRSGHGPQASLRPAVPGTLGAPQTARPGSFGAPAVSTGANGTAHTPIARGLTTNPAPGNLALPGAVAGGAQGSSTSGARAGMMPAGMMGGGRGKNRSGKSGAVKGVTSAVEREGNLKALLGDGPAVIPGVIGAWVREPR
ncbi:hypothetical protein QP027_07365 [Corynebacterium breve]|uniref:PPE family protein n=1 Tax=Corynebacterium breve TaxID=3049799 RepID=A0ABY8VCW8_9CORY|nr:hypothetical protein [Corynebacterium breve]WIM66952.1 hypothetical protein QP027_07365 [Corynebacterium breve]